MEIRVRASGHRGEAPSIPRGQDLKDACAALSVESPPLWEGWSAARGGVTAAATLQVCIFPSLSLLTCKMGTTIVAATHKIAGRLQRD